MCTGRERIHFPADSLLWAPRLPHYHAAPAITAGTSSAEKARLSTRMLMVAQRFRGENLGEDFRTAQPFCFPARGSPRPWLAPLPPTTPIHPFPTYAPIRAGSTAERNGPTFAFIAGPVYALFGFIYQKPYGSPPARSIPERRTSWCVPPSLPGSASPTQGTSYT